MSSSSHPRLAMTIAGLLALCAMGSVLGTAHAATGVMPEPPRSAPQRGDLPATVGFNEPIGGFGR